MMQVDAENGPSTASLPKRQDAEDSRNGFDVKQIQEKFHHFKGDLIDSIERNTHSFGDRLDLIACCDQPLRIRHKNLHTPPLDSSSSEPQFRHF
ncbi:MAG: hypothetical protein KDA72_18250, partial [Planctomycetales bacterium]|nr:hypothetical protein [Planctomycetales bacterium]